jgi:phosphatidylglycerol:prolipoprotein diacylglycerol transferase
LFALLLGMFWKAPKLKEGTWVWTYVVGYSLIRIPYEILRVSAVAYLGNTSIKVAYVASAVGILLGVGMLIYLYRFRFDPDLEAITLWMIHTAQLDPAVARTIVQRVWALQKRHSRSELVERVTLAMPYFPASLAPTLSTQQREDIMQALLHQLEGQSVDSPLQISGSVN